MRRELVLNYAITSSIGIGVCVILIAGASFFSAGACAWSISGKRYEVTVKRGSMAVFELSKYKYTHPIYDGFFEPETQAAYDDFKTLPWYHGDNSWWERVGYTISHRRRFGGFEYATGTYMPPFVWQHRTMPITVYQIPLMMIAAWFFLPIVLWHPFLWSRLALDGRYYRTNMRLSTGTLVKTSRDACQPL